MMQPNHPFVLLSIATIIIIITLQSAVVLSTAFRFRPTTITAFSFHSYYPPTATGISISVTTGIARSRISINSCSCSCDDDDGVGDGDALLSISKNNDCHPNNNNIKNKNNISHQVEARTTEDDEKNNNVASTPTSPTALACCPQRRTILSRASSAMAGTLTASLLQTTTSSSPSSSSSSSSSSSFSQQQQHLFSSSGNGCNCRCRIYNNNNLLPIAVPPAANALVELTPPSPDLLQTYDRPRNTRIDNFFSYSMSSGMEGYESKARPYKTKLFHTLFDSLSTTIKTTAAAAAAATTQNNNEQQQQQQLPVVSVLEVGMGTFPNAPYYVQAMKDSGMEELGRLDIISLDPNDSMFQYAKTNAETCGLLSSTTTTTTTSSSSSSSSSSSLRNVHGVAEALPFPADSIDAIVSTLTLCSVSDQARSLSEFRRVLKPASGKLLFWEHVLSEDDPTLALQQRILSPIQTLVADGCHLNRRTGATIREAGFEGGVEMEYVDLGGTILDGSDVISPTVFGIATA